MEKFNFIRTFIIALYTVFTILMIGFGSASAFVVDLTYPNESGMPIMPYAVVTGTVDSSNENIFHFSIELASGLGDDLNGGSNFGMDMFFFNTDLDPSMLILDFGSEEWNIAYNKEAAGFGKFDLKPVDSTKSDRSTYLYFDIISTEPLTEANFFLLADDPAGNGNGYFAAHIAGFDYKGYGSIFARHHHDTPVPAPSTILLLGGGLLALAFYTRKIRTQRSEPRFCTGQCHRASP